MNEIIKELYIIEERAGQIMENTKERRLELQKNQREQEALIEQELKQEMEGRLTVLKSGVEEQAGQEIQEIMKKKDAFITNLNQEYDGNYENKAMEILKRITEV